MLGCVTIGTRPQDLRRRARQNLDATIARARSETGLALLWLTLHDRYWPERAAWSSMVSAGIASFLVLLR